MEQFNSRDMLERQPNQSRRQSVVCLAEAHAILAGKRQAFASDDFAGSRYWIKWPSLWSDLPDGKSSPHLLASLAKRHRNTVHGWQARCVRSHHSGISKSPEPRDIVRRLWQSGPSLTRMEIARLRWLGTGLLVQHPVAVVAARRAGSCR